MKSQVLDHYDWIIIGDHPGALSASLSLIDAGLSVLVVPNLEEENRQAIHLEESNWCPEFLAPEGLDPVQILTPDRRFKVLSSEADFQSEWKEVFGVNSNPSEIHQKKYQDLAKGLSFIYRGHDLSVPMNDDFKRCLLKAREQRYFPGGKTALKRYLKNKIIKNGGQVLEHERCQQIFVDGKGFKGIQLHGASKMITAQAGIVAMYWESAKLLLSQAQSLKSDPKAWWFTFQFQIPEEMVPLGATTKMIFADHAAPAVEIEQKGAVWIARTLVPFSESSLEREFQRKTAQRIFKLLESIFPFIEYGASDLNPDLKDPERVESYDLVQLYPFRDLAHIPASLLAFGGNGLGHQLPFANLFLAHDESYPTYGEWAGYHSAALGILDWAKKLQKVLPDDLKRLIIS